MLKINLLTFAWLMLLKSIHLSKLKNFLLNYIINSLVYNRKKKYKRRLITFYRD